MSWQEGFFSFEERAVADVPLDARIRISTESLLMEGARRIDEWSRIARQGAAPRASCRCSRRSRTTARRVLDLLPHEWEVLTMIDGDARPARHRRRARARASSTSRRSRTASCPPAWSSCSRAQTPRRRRRRRSAPSRRSSARARALAGGRRRGGAVATRAPRSRRDPASTEARLLAARALSRLDALSPTPWTSCGAPCRAIRSRRQCISTSASRPCASATSRARTRAGSTTCGSRRSATDAGRVARRARDADAAACTSSEAHADG